MMSEWIHYKMDDICDISSSKRIYRNEYVETGIPFYRGKEIILKANNEKLKETLFISEEKYQQIKERYDVPIPGDILLTSVGTLGIPYVVKDGEIFYFKDGNLTWFRNYKDIVNRKYFYFWLLSPKMKNQINATRIGVAQPALTIVGLKNFGIDLPPLPTQKKIASILSAYDNLIENNTRRIQILEEMAQRIYKEWFVDFKYPGHENDELVDSDLGMIPEGWELKKTGEVFGIIGGGTPSTKVPGYWENGTINWYSPKDLTKSDSMFALTSGSQISDLGLQKSSAKLFPAFSVMLTSRATIGVVAINTTEACTNQGFITCIPSENMSTYQIYYWLLNNIKMFLAYSSGATFKELTKTTFKKFDLVVPPKKTSSLFNELVIPIASEILTLQKQNGNLSQTRDLLLPKLISGKIDVSDLEIDTSILND